MGVYLYPNNTETELKNAYIGEYWWHPWANTIAYYPFKNDILDETWNTSLSWSWTKDTIWYTFSTNNSISNASSTKFVSYWFKLNSYSGNWSSLWHISSLWELCYWVSQTRSYSWMVWSIGFFKNSSWSSYSYKNVWIDTNQWHHIAYWYDGNNIVWYFDGIEYTIWSWYYNFGSDVILLRLWNDWATNVTFSDVILENAARTAQEIANYYNQTKSNYGL
jgi:hypothetical protein